MQLHIVHNLIYQSDTVCAGCGRLSPFHLEVSNLQFAIVFLLTLTGFYCRKLWQTIHGLLLLPASGCRQCVWSVHMACSCAQRWGSDQEEYSEGQKQRGTDALECCWQMRCGCLSASHLSLSQLQTLEVALEVRRTLDVALICAIIKITINTYNLLEYLGFIIHTDFI